MRHTAANELRPPLWSRGEAKAELSAILLWHPETTYDPDACTWHIWWGSTRKKMWTTRTYFCFPALLWLSLSVPFLTLLLFLPPPPTLKKPLRNQYRYNFAPFPPFLPSLFWQKWGRQGGLKEKTRRGEGFTNELIKKFLKASWELNFSLKMLLIIIVEFTFSVDDNALNVLLRALKKRRRRIRLPQFSYFPTCSSPCQRRSLAK